MNPTIQIAELRRRIRNITTRAVAAHGFYPCEIYLGHDEMDAVKVDVGSGSGYEIRNEGVFYLGLRLHETTAKSHIGVGVGE